MHDGHGILGRAQGRVGAGDVAEVRVLDGEGAEVALELAQLGVGAEQGPLPFIEGLLGDGQWASRTWAFPSLVRKRTRSRAK